ncbi:coagulation factor X-like [Numenius arquata]|uniref:coagulation factor X-like n=1 Tax=Numenius arquata TaxID=31919 RepID=UPI003D30AAF3
MATAGHHGRMWLFPVVLLFLQLVQTVIPNACKVNNGNCEQFCKAEDDQVVCSCAAGYALGNDNKTCVPVVKFPCGKLQRNYKAGREKVGGTTASPDAHPENEETAEAPSSHPEITGEADSLPSVCPWHAVLIEDEDGEWFCGGTILNEYFILSGAQCINQYKNLRVLVGMVDKDNEEPSRSMHRVEKIIAHAEFNTETFDNDIALLKLEEPITFSEDVVPACLPEEDFAKNVLMNQTFGIVSGFGKRFELGQTVKRMKVLQIPYVDRDTCKLSLRNPVKGNMFCAGYDKDGEDVCQGDGGGPHVTQYKGTYFVTGIISWGEGCGRQGKYGVYTNLSKFLPWVRSVLTENS